MSGNRWIIAVMVLGVSMSGCARQKELERINREQAASIVTLNKEIADLNNRLAELSKAKSDLEKTKRDLERKLRAELLGGDVTLSMQDRGLVVTVLDRVLFDSGKATIKESALQTLDKVSEILNRNARGNRIYVEGHTDNEPIRYSGWKSNWELSTARATEVIHYLSESASIDPHQLVASGYGEYHPVEDNSTAEGKERNRRVEIVISPRKIGPKPVSAKAAPVEAGEGSAADVTSEEEVIK
ncbi:MAG: OmpA family protein [Candidatus Omnitrophica bacterium]|nr:OmpA family protein [Candidatus Omnitrophota bacterium]